MSTKGKKKKKDTESEESESKKTKSDEKDEKKEGIILGYWKIRGLAQPIRLLLEYQNVPYSDKYYVCGGPPNFDRGQWLSEKTQIGINFSEFAIFN